MYWGWQSPIQSSKYSIAKTMRLRYCWLGRDESGVLFVTMYLRPPVLDARLDSPQLFDLPGFDLSKPPENESGEWVDKELTDHNSNSSRPPYDVLFPTLLVGSGAANVVAKPLHGVVEIDRIQPASSVSARRDCGATLSGCRADEAYSDLANRRVRLNRSARPELADRDEV
jgi:hypothetical protein